MGWSEVTSDIAIKPRRTTACYDLRANTIAKVRNLSMELGVPAGDVVEWCITSALSKVDPVQVMTPARIATLTPGRYPYRLRVR
jgi:hypothetical protein